MVGGSTEPTFFAVFTSNPVFAFMSSTATPGKRHVKSRLECIGIEIEDAFRRHDPFRVIAVEFVFAAHLFAGMRNVIDVLDQAAFVMRGVLAHTACGAVKAACDVVTKNSTYPGAIGPMIEPILPAALAARGQEGDYVNNTAKLSAQRTAARLPSTSKLISDLVGAGKLKIVAAIYDLETGVVDLGRGGGPAWRRWRGLWLRFVCRASFETSVSRLTRPVPRTIAAG